MPERTTRRGLVLEGGGAKGAYSFGALLAFREVGLTFDAVAGTSVGALNAVLWSSDSMDLGRRLWMTLTRSAVFRVRKLSMLAPVIGVGQLYRGYLSQTLPDVVANVVDPYFAWPTAIAVNVIPVGMIAAATHAYTGVVSAILVALLVGFFFVRWSRERLPRYSVAETTIYLLFGVIVNVAAFVLRSRLSAVALIALLIWGLPALLYLAGSLGDRLGLSFFAPDPLRREIREILKQGLHVPTYVTAAEAREDIYDPDDLTWQAFFDEMGGLTGWQLNANPALVPTYHRVDLIDAEEAEIMITASAALPLGIAKPIRTAERTFVDGGVIDNTPFFPMVSFVQCDEVVILRLGTSSMGPGDDGGRKKRWAFLDRLIRRANLRSFKAPDEGVNVYNDPPTELPYRDPPDWPRFIVLSPSTSLGNLLTGTLNFSAKRSRRLMQWGYRDALHAVKTHWPELTEKAAAAERRDPAGANT